MKIDNLEKEELEYLINLLSKQPNESGSFSLFAKIRQQALAQQAEETKSEEKEPKKQKKSEEA